MNKMLKQLMLVLEENSITPKKIEVLDSEEKNREAIRVNDDYYVEYFKESETYRVYVRNVYDSLGNFKSLTEALDKLVEYLIPIKEGDVLVSVNNDTVYKVIKCDNDDFYNLLNIDTNRLAFFTIKDIRYLVHLVDDGTLVKKNTEDSKMY